MSVPSVRVSHTQHLLAMNPTLWTDQVSHVIQIWISFGVNFWHVMSRWVWLMRRCWLLIHPWLLIQCWLLTRHWLRLQPYESKLGIEDYVGASSTHGVGPCLAIFDSIREDGLHLANVYPTPLFSRAQMKGVIIYMMELLQAAADGNVAWKTLVFVLKPIAVDVEIDLIFFMIRKVATKNSSISCDLIETYVQ